MLLDARSAPLQPSRAAGRKLLGPAPELIFSADSFWSRPFDQALIYLANYAT
jgi:hypothetical protein